MSPNIDLRFPSSWEARHMQITGKRAWIVMAAFSPRNWTVGIEVIRGYGNGFALVVGPLWIGLAVTAPLADKQERRA